MSNQMALLTYSARLSTRDCFTSGSRLFTALTSNLCSLYDPFSAQLSSSMPSPNGPSAQQWEAQRMEITRLWISEDKTLKQLMQFMRTQGFQATSPQYKRQLKKWKLSKNLTSKEWIYISRGISQRLHQGKQTHVLFHGRRLEEAKVRKEVTRHDRPLLQRISTPPEVTDIRFCSPFTDCTEQLVPIFNDCFSISFIQLIDTKGIYFAAK